MMGVVVVGTLWRPTAFPISIGEIKKKILVIGKHYS